KYTSWIKRINPYYEEYEIIRSEIQRVPKFYTAQQLFSKVYTILSPLLDHDYGGENNDFFQELINGLCPKFDQSGEWENYSTIISSQFGACNPNVLYRIWGDYYINHPNVELHLDVVSDIKELIIYNLSECLDDFTIIPLQHGAGFCDKEGECLFKIAIKMIGEL
ncbi:MAG: hypothetical protein K2K94_01295, partial [Muribaculaceae bacterium]|nr:hypothetical protein [Muribaculaceae bacterium]